MYRTTIEAGYRDTIVVGRERSDNPDAGQWQRMDNAAIAGQPLKDSHAARILACAELEAVESCGMVFIISETI